MSLLEIAMSGTLTRLESLVALTLHPLSCDCSIDPTIVTLSPQGEVLDVAGQGPGEHHGDVVELLLVTEHDRDLHSPQIVGVKSASRIMALNNYWLRARGGDCTTSWERLSAEVDATAGVANSLASAAPLFRVAADMARTDIGALVETTMALQRRFALGPASLAALKGVQSEHLAIYGRLSFETALAWMFEELAELGQAVRRGESISRLHEELGQVFGWVVCMGNILDIDVGQAASTALWREALRQLAKYGELRPAPGVPS